MRVSERCRGLRLRPAPEAVDEKLWSRDRVPVPVLESESVKSVGAEKAEDPLGLAGTDDGVGKM